MRAGRPSSFSLAVAISSLLLTLVIVQSIWESYYPPREREALRRRREHYEEVLVKADLSWKEGLYYRVVEEKGKRP